MLRALAGPDPARLAADWWTFFAPEEALDEAGLKERADTLDLSLEKLRGQLERGKRNDVQPAVARLRKLMADSTTRREQKTILRDALPPPLVWLVSFGESSLDFEPVVWLTPEAVKRPAGVQAAYLWEIESKLHQYGIEIPFPQRDLHLRSGFEQLKPAGQTAPPELI